MKSKRSLTVYRKLSVPDDIAKKIERVARKLKYPARNGRWDLLNFLLEDAEKNPDVYGCF